MSLFVDPISAFWSYFIGSSYGIAGLNLFGDVKDHTIIYRHHSHVCPDTENREKWYFCRQHIAVRSLPPRQFEKLILASLFRLGRLFKLRRRQSRVFNIEIVGTILRRRNFSTDTSSDIRM